MNLKSNRLILMLLATAFLLVLFPTQTYAKKEVCPPKDAQLTEYYFKTKKPIKTWIGVDNPTAHMFQSRWITIPKGTIVSGHPIEVKNKQIKKITVVSSSLSYHVKKAAVMPGYYLEAWQDLTGDINYSNARFEKVKKPPYMAPYSDGNFYLGTSPKEYPDTFLSNRLMISSDGYVDLYQYQAGVGPEGFGNKPMGSAKITKTIAKKNVRYLYYRHHVNGLNDKRVNKTGKYQYRLTVADKDDIRTQTIWDDGKQSFVARIYYAHYDVGGVTYYTEVGEKPLDD